jgi:succinoglycan biosynthesis protein ExoA
LDRSASNDNLDAPTLRCLIVVPCLNEAPHIGPLLDRLDDAANALGAMLVVADGGSTDGTVDVVRRKAEAMPRLRLLDNPKRVQSAAVNRAVEDFGDGADFLIRIDAHGDYPHDYCRVLVEEAIAGDADSVVVAMETRGIGIFQKAVASAQNSLLGNGGARHRSGAVARWVDHGHHALMRVDAFRAVGGYDESFSHNEDAELDYRLRQAGYRIWMTDRTVMTYYPRPSIAGLFRQYVGYGRGRAKNALKHRAMPRLRQLLPLAVVPIVAGTLLAFMSWMALLPVTVWMCACFAYGAWMAVGQRNPLGPIAAFAAIVMHAGWSIGFWMQLLDFRQRRRTAT